MIVSFTGHRPTKIGGYKIPNPTHTYICKELTKILQELKPEKAISGMALGWDQYATEVCIELKIPFIAAVPFLGQESMWPKVSQDKYNDLLKQAIEIKIVCDGAYAPWKMQTRNQFMVDNSDLVIACFDKTPGGTKNCVDYAIKKNKKVIVINPNDNNIDTRKI